MAQDPAVSDCVAHQQGNAAAVGGAGVLRELLGARQRLWAGNAVSAGALELFLRHGRSVDNPSGSQADEDTARWITVYRWSALLLQRLHELQFEGAAGIFPATWIHI